MYHALIDRSPEERALLLSGVSTDLRGELESLLAHDATPLDSRRGLSATESPVQIGAGTQLGPYKIEIPIGKGGMGQVFAAVDSRPGRKVAIKISSEQFSERFERGPKATLRVPSRPCAPAREGWAP